MLPLLLTERGEEKGMNTINMVLMIILSVMIGFAIGNIWGKETMKRTFAELISKLTEGLKIAAESTGSQNKKESER